ncbi:P-loop containing nucleoside triphosphate hydrolase protein, partial [Armillaria mellea]
RSFLLHGMGGIGKSQIALKFAQNKQQSEYFSIILWIDATSESTIVQSWKDIQAKYDSILKNSFTSSENNQSRVLDWISHYDQQEWLLIYDNADHDDISLLKRYIPAGESGNILITSRNPYLARITDNVKEAVSEMCLTEALELFFKASNLQNSDINIYKHAKAIVTRLGFIPLAIDLAGSSIAGEFYTIHEYLDLLDKNREVILKKTFNTEHEQNIYESWNMSLNAIQSQAERHNSNAQYALEILELLSFFYNNNISEEIFHRAA